MELVFAKFKPQACGWQEGINFAAIGEEFQLFLASCQDLVDGNEIGEKVISCTQLILDLTWEQLHTGHWKDVDINWRFLYRQASHFSAWGHLMRSCEAESIKEALKRVDMGLLMGAPMPGDKLTGFAAVLHSRLTSMTPQTVTSEDLVPKKRKKIGIPSCSQLNPSGSVPVVSCPDIPEFDAQFYRPQLPVIITEAIDNWPAMDNWSVAYVRQMAEFRSVPVEIGRKYTDAEWGQKIMSIGQFIDKYLSDDATELGYLAQHQLFDQIPELGADLLTPDYTVVSTDESEVDINVWFGPAGTVSPLHTDPRDNMLVQIFGRKYVRLYAPSEPVYPNLGSLMENTSLVDIENPNFEDFPVFAKAQFQELFLERGQMLYIPKLWWHYVKSLEPSMSISYWF